MKEAQACQFGSTVFLSFSLAFLMILVLNTYLQNQNYDYGRTEFVVPEISSNMIQKKKIAKNCTNVQKLAFAKTHKTGGE